MKVKEASSLRTTGLVVGTGLYLVVLLLKRELPTDGRGTIDRSVHFYSERFELLACTLGPERW